MSVLTDLVDEVATVKSDIKVAIKNKGVSVTDDVPFTEYASKIDQIQASNNPQNKIAYTSGIITYDTSDKIFYGYNTSNVWPSEFHAIGETVWIESTAKSNDVAFNSKIINDNQIVPDFTKPIGIILDITEWNGAYLNIYTHSGMYIQKNGLSHTVINNYDSLNSVTIDYASMKALGVSAGQSLNITTPVVKNYAFTGDTLIKTIVCDAIDIGTGAFTQLWDLTSITLNNYEGTTFYRNEETGYIQFNQTYSQIIESQALNTLNVPNLRIAPGNFANNTYNREGTLTFSAPKLEGILSGTFIGYEFSGNDKDKPYSILKNANIDFRLLKYLGYGMDPILRAYVDDSDNNITDTLTFPNIEYLDQNVFYYTTIYFPEITSLNFPKLKCINNYAHLNHSHIFNITTLDLPEIEFIGNEAFGWSNGINEFNLGSTCKYIESNAFSGTNNSIINIDLPEPTQAEIEQGSWKSYAPWGAENTTVNWTGTATQTTLHKYDRVDNKATVVDFFTDNNSQRYALCVVDAQYRSTEGYKWSNSNEDFVSEPFATYEDTLTDTHTAKYYTDIVLNNYDITEFPAFDFAKNACSVTCDNNTYSSYLPTLNELLAIRDDAATLDSYDPTLSTYSSNSLVNWSFGNAKPYIGICQEKSNTSDITSIVVSTSGYQAGRAKISTRGVCPVIEIPVDANGTVISI